jgi:DNA-binding response OmpR family regulator/cytochrome c-type biogenesis protein CcmH/NrfG
MPSLQNTATTRRNRPPSHLFGPLNVLVVDDMPAIRRMLRQMLLYLGVKGDILEAADGLEAWNVLEQTPYDLVVCDINMPRMNGLELLRRLRSTAQYETTPFLIITGEVSEDIVAASAESEVDGYILKPFRVDSLEKRLRAIVLHRRHPTRGEAFFRKAKKLLADGHPTKALTILEKLASPPFRLQAKVFNQMGECHLALGSPGEAATCFDQTLELNPKYLKAYQNLAAIFEVQGDLTAARHCLEEARHLSPLNSERLFQLGQLCLRGGDPEKARRYLQEALKCGYQTPPDLRREAAETFLAAGMEQTAEDLFRQVLAASPDDVRLYNRLGIALRRQQKYHQALDCYRQALHLDPQSPQVHFNLGVLYLELGEPDKAQAAVQAALALRPDFAEARDLLRRSSLPRETPVSRDQ